jgi:hypothetical protein
MFFTGHLPPVVLNLCFPRKEETSKTSGGYLDMTHWLYLFAHVSLLDTNQDKFHVISTM